MILGIDPGQARIGVAIGDVDARTATPLEVIDARTTDPLDRIEAIVSAMAITLVVVGRPISLSGHAGSAVERQQQLVERLKSVLEIEVVELDERLTSVIADRSLRDAGKTAKAARKTRDAIAAQVLLQSYIDAQPDAR